MFPEIWGQGCVPKTGRPRTMGFVLLSQAGSGKATKNNTAASTVRIKARNHFAVFEHRI